MCIVKMNGEKVRTFADPIKAAIWADRWCKGKVEIVSLTETEMPKANKMRKNALIENYGAYKYNPFAEMA